MNENDPLGKEAEENLANHHGFFSLIGSLGSMKER